MNPPRVSATRPRLVVLIMASLLTTTCPQAPSQAAQPAPGGPEPRDLIDLRRQFTLRALVAGRMLAEQYSNALAGLESQAVEGGDYETAMVALQRRQELAALYAISDLDTAQAIILKPGDAKTVGAITFDKSENGLVNWRTAGSSATWDVFKIEPGAYTVSLVYGLADTGAAPSVGGSSEALTGGEVEFGEVTGLIGADSSKLTTALKATGGWTSFETITLGNIKLAHTSARLTLKAMRLRGAGGLMHLKEVRLAPTRPSPAAPDTGAAKLNMDELDKVRAAHENKLRELEQPVLNDHLSRLTALGHALTSKKDGEGAEAVAAEVKRAKKTLEKPGANMPAMPHAVFAEEMEEIRDARFVDDPANTGDRFLVAAKGGQFFIRLMLVACPSPGAPDGEGDAFFTGYFGISKEDCVNLGRQARDFTTNYLRDKTLRLLTRGQQDKTGSLAAIVLPPEVGSFAGILVDNGLAAISKSATKKSTHAWPEDHALSDLKEREARARSKPVPPGAWALSAETKRES